MNTNGSSEIQKSKRRALLSLVGCVLLCHMAGILGAIGMRGQVASEWYRTLQKPPIQPPGWVFGPVWMLLYTMMGVALWFVLRQGWSQRKVRVAVCAFLVQLALNASWTPVFFGLHQPRWAFLVIILLWLGIAGSIMLFKRVSLTATILMIPYLAWVSFAAVLNGWISAIN